MWFTTYRLVITFSNKSTKTLAELARFSAANKEEPAIYLKRVLRIRENINERGSRGQVKLCAKMLIKL